MCCFSILDTLPRHARNQSQLTAYADSRWNLASFSPPDESIHLFDAPFSVTTVCFPSLALMLFLVRIDVHEAPYVYFTVTLRLERGIIHKMRAF